MVEQVTKVRSGVVLYLETEAALRIEPATRLLAQDQFGLMEFSFEAGEGTAAGQDLELKLLPRFSIHSVEIDLARPGDPTVHFGGKSYGLSLRNNVVRFGLLQDRRRDMDQEGRRSGDAAIRDDAQRMDAPEWHRTPLEPAG